MKKKKFFETQKNLIMGKLINEVGYIKSDAFDIFIELMNKLGKKKEIYSLQQREVVELFKTVILEYLDFFLDKLNDEELPDTETKLFLVDLKRLKELKEREGFKQGAELI